MSRKECIMQTYEAPAIVEAGEFSELTRGVIGVRHEAVGYFFG